MSRPMDDTAFEALMLNQSLGDAIITHQRKMKNKITELEKKLHTANKEGFAMSAQVTYLERLVQEYETIILKEKQDEIKKFIFSEDDR